MKNELIGSEPPETESITFDELTQCIVMITKVYEDNWRDENRAIRDLALSHAKYLIAEQQRRIEETK